LVATINDREERIPSESKNLEKDISFKIGVEQREKGKMRTRDSLKL